MSAGAAFALGSGVGLALALTGAGGGLLAMPLLTIGLGLSVAAAGPVALIAVGGAAALGALLGLREGKVRYRAAMLIGAVGMLLAPMGASIARRLPETVLTLLLSAVMALAAWSTYRRSRAVASNDDAARSEGVPCRLDPATGRFVWNRACATVLGGIGSVSGLLSGLLGVGGGFVIVPALTRWSTLTGYAIVCTSQAVIALVSLSAVTSAAALGHLAWPVALPFAGGAVVALLVARRWARRWAGPTLQQGFAVLCGVMALGVLLRAWAA